jgi:pimeloyl-ACP methyl ester carboxylesterase
MEAEMTIDSTMMTVRGVDLEVLTGGAGSDTFLVWHGELGIDESSALLAALAEHGRVVAPLLPGYGRSPASPSTRTMLDVTLLALDVLDAIAGDGEAPIVVGHSMGGMIAAEMAAIAANDVRRLALVAPLGLWLDAHPIPDIFAMTPRDLVDVSYIDGAGEHAALDDPEHLAAVLVRNLRQLTMAGKVLFPIPDRGLADRIGRIKARTVVVWGSDDRYLHPAYADAFVAGVPHAAMLSIDGGGHLVTEERATEVAAAIVEHLAPVVGAVTG